MTMDAVKTLQNIKGIGKVLSQRLVDSGLDSYAKIVAAGEAGLRSVSGLQPNLIPSILAQAAKLEAEEGSQEAGNVVIVASPDSPTPADQTGKQDKRSRKLVALQSTVSRLRSRIHGLVADIMVKKEGLVDKASGRRLQKEMGKILTSLTKVEANLAGRRTKAQKGLAKSEKRLEALAEAGPNKLLRGLKKARRPLKRILG